MNKNAAGAYKMLGLEKNKKYYMKIQGDTLTTVHITYGDENKELLILSTGIQSWKINDNLPMPPSEDYERVSTLEFEESYFKAINHLYRTVAATNKDAIIDELKNKIDFLEN